MFRTTIITTVAAAVLATSISFAPTAATASDYGHEVAPVSNSASQRDRIIAGAVIGIAAALLGADMQASGRESYRERKMRRHRAYDDQHNGMIRKVSKRKAFRITSQRVFID